MYLLSTRDTGSLHQTLEAAQRQFVAMRDASGEGASTFATGTIRDANANVTYTISYNGRVWNGNTMIAEMPAAVA